MARIFAISIRPQRTKQQSCGKSDQDLRSAVAEGAQMDGFIDLFRDIIVEAGIPRSSVFRKKTIELPGFFRPTKEWDLLVVHESRLLAAIEAKSQVGPSFRKSSNNRNEEAMGSALDLWTAFRERSFLDRPPLFVGCFLLEDSPASSRSVIVQEPHFKRFPDFVSASCVKCYEIFCRKLVLERHYSAAAFATSKALEGIAAVCQIPAPDLSIERFSNALSVSVGASA